MKKSSSLSGVEYPDRPKSPSEPEGLGKSRTQ